MATIAELIETLKTKNQSEEVEYIVYKPTGELVTCLIKPSPAVNSIIKVLKQFKD